MNKAYILNILVILDPLDIPDIILERASPQLLLYNNNTIDECKNNICDVSKELHTERKTIIINNIS